MLGGSADLTGSVFTDWSGGVPVTREQPGNYIHYGVREFGMSAIMNGLALHGGFIPYAGTFLTFSDYARNAVRMAALMKLRAIHVYTHDSIGLGEDGPTHQSIEHAASLRLIPNLDVWRPCDTVETAVAWAAAIERRPARTRADGAAVHAAERAVRPAQRAADRRHPPRRLRAGRLGCGGAAAGDRHRHGLGGGARAGGARTARRRRHRRARRLDALHAAFDAQDAAWRASVLPPGTARVAVEAGSTDGWRKYTGAADDPKARCSASTPSANRRRQACCSGTSG